MTTSLFVIPSREHTMSRIDIAKQYIHAAQTGNQALLASLVSADVVWHQPGNNRFSGTHRGLPAVGAMLGGMMEVSKGTFSITNADHFMENGEWVAIRLEFHAQREGARLAQPGVDLLRIEAGKIVEVRLFSGDQEEEDAFWGR
jgi:ketosteroid isomerase-like protein